MAVLRADSTADLLANQMVDLLAGKSVGCSAVDLVGPLAELKVAGLVARSVVRSAEQKVV